MNPVDYTGLLLTLALLSVGQCLCTILNAMQLKIRRYILQ